MTLQIRIAGMQDAAHIGELLANITDYPQWTEVGAAKLTEHALAGLKSADHTRTFLVACVDNKVVGYCAAYWIHPLFGDAEGYISELFIRSNASGQGIGTALLEAIKTEARERKCGRLTLVNLKNRESYKRGFYASRGWEEKSNTVRFAIDVAAN